MYFCCNMRTDPDISKKDFAKNQFNNNGLKKMDKKYQNIKR